MAASALARGRGHAIALYDALFSVACAAGHNLIVCGMNEVPPNPISAGLHARFGFVKAGEVVLPEMAKTVGYFVKKIIVLVLAWHLFTKNAMKILGGCYKKHS